MYNKHNYLNNLFEIGSLYSKISVNETELLSVNRNEPLSWTADSEQGQADLCNAAPQSADTSLPINVTEAGLAQASTMQTDLLAPGSQVRDSSRKGKLESENKDYLDDRNSLNVLEGLDETNCKVCDIPTKKCSCTMLNKDYCQICKFENTICTCIKVTKIT